jgi:hypothetical protein
MVRLIGKHIILDENLFLEVWGGAEKDMATH